jgi:hypothetical protein
MANMDSDDVGFGFEYDDLVEPVRQVIRTRKVWIPECPLELKPRKGMEFSSLEDGIMFYKTYALNSGFDTRRGGEKKKPRTNTVNFKYIFCVKEGEQPFAEEDTTDKLQRRYRMSTRT